MKTRLFLVAILFVSMATSLVAQTKYSLDTQASKLVWLAKKVTGEHTGTVQLASGEFTIDAKGNLSSGKFEADMTTIKNTDVTSPEYSAKLDGHLKSEDFFGVEKFPKATFVLTKVAKIVKGNALVKGNMTIKGKTVPIEFKAVFQEAADGMKVYANITLDRTKFDIRYGSGSFFENLGDKTIYDDFNITLTLVNKKK